MRIEAPAGSGDRRERAVYWEHPSVEGVDLLRASFLTQSFSRHTHDAYALAVIDGGVEQFRYRGELHDAPAGSVALVDIGEVHTGHSGTPDGWRYQVLYPSGGAVDDIAREVTRRTGTPHFPTAVVHDPRAAELVRRAAAAASGADDLSASATLREALAYLLVRHGDHAPRPTRRAGPRALHRAKELLRADLVRPPSLTELAAAVGCSPFALVRAFGAAEGLPPHAWLNQQRVVGARALLDRGVPPAQVAAHVGFVDQSHLTRHFRRALGVPPGAYLRGRKNVQDRPDRAS